MPLKFYYSLLILWLLTFLYISVVCLACRHTHKECVSYSNWSELCSVGYVEGGAGNDQILNHFRWLWWGNGFINRVLIKTFFIECYKCEYHFWKTLWSLMTPILQADSIMSTIAPLSPLGQETSRRRDYEKLRRKRTADISWAVQWTKLPFFDQFANSSTNYG